MKMTKTGAFDPNAFFEGVVTGVGVLRRLGGRVYGRYTVDSVGTVAEAGGLLSVKEMYRFEGGSTDEISWSMPGSAAPLKPDARVSGHIFTGMEGNDYVMAFNRRVASPRGKATLRLHVRFSLLAPGRAMSFTRISWLGLPMGSMVTIYDKLHGVAP